MACDDRVDYPAVVSSADGPSIGDGIVWDGEKWITSASVGGANTFIELVDTPNDYTGSADYIVVVKTTEDGLEFTAAAQGVGEANTSSNQGAGQGLAMAKSGIDLPFKTLVEGNNISLSSDADTITITSADVIRDHGNLTGLSDDDHVQYSRTDGGRAFTGTVAGIDPVGVDDLTTKQYVDNLINAPGTVDHFNLQNIGIKTHVQIDDHINDLSIHFLEEDITHGNLLGLSADDHPQYSFTDGTRDFTGPVGGVDPVANEDLATKQYVDASPLNIQNGTTYTLVLSDVRKMVVMTSNSNNSITIPSDANLSFVNGSEIHIIQKGTGSTSVQIETPDSLFVDPSLTLTLHDRYAVATVKKIDTNEWVLFGNLELS